jgi:hypothetical protein
MDITPCSLLELNRRFEGICYHHLKGQTLSQARNQHEEEVSSLTEDRNLHDHCCENLESYMAISDFFIQNLGV